MEQTIPLMVESDQGSIKTEVQKEDIPDKVKDELKDDKWVTLENEDCGEIYFEGETLEQAIEGEKEMYMGLLL